jgi:hypothetical protein
MSVVNKDGSVSKSWPEEGWLEDTTTIGSVGPMPLCEMCGHPSEDYGNVPRM